MKNMAQKSLPVLVPDRLLISPGIWNDNEYSAEEISEGFTRTDWGNKDKISLWLNHDDRNTSAFVGYVRNPRLEEGGKVFGDLEIWDEQTATILTEAMAKFGISAKIAGKENKKTGKMSDFTFENFSVVTTPACEEAYINLSKKENDTVSKYLISSEKEMAEVTGMEAERKKRGMTPAQFYAVPRDPPSSSSLPIFDKAHTQNAMARFNQTNLSPEEKASAKRKIIAAANKFGIKVSDEFKSLSNSNVRGFKEMGEEEIKEEEKVEEAKEEVVEEVAEESEKEMLKNLSLKFDKLIALLSKKELAEEETVEEKSEEEAPAEEAAEEAAEENKELTAVKKELAEIKAKLDKPKSKTAIKNLSSNTVGNEMKFNENLFCEFLGAVDKPMKII